MQVRPIRPIRATISGSEQFESAAEYLLHLINDPLVNVRVKVRAAAVLLAHEGRKKQADRLAAGAHKGTAWERILG